MFERKLFADNIFIQMIVYMIHFPIRPKVDFFVTIPMTVIANTMLLRASLTTEDGNMDCFVDPSKYTKEKLTHYSVVFLFACIYWFITKKRALNMFL